MSAMSDAIDASFDTKDDDAAVAARMELEDAFAESTRKVQDEIDTKAALKAQALMDAQAAREARARAPQTEEEAKQLEADLALARAIAADDAAEAVTATTTDTDKAAGETPAPKEDDEAAPKK